MPQEFHVVQCYSCQMFQVDIVKKVPKWCCKLCGEKQSLKKIFGTGTSKECRNFVQSLNADLISKTGNKFVSPSTRFELETGTVVPTESKWDEFFDESELPPSDGVKHKVSIFEDQEKINLNLEI